MENPAHLRVLIVDDEPLIRWCLAETLADAGHSVTEAGDGETAVRLVAGNRESFDVVVLDYRLPDSKDLSLLANIRRAAPRSAVIVMTAYGTPEITAGALKLGAYRVVPKPFEVREMAELVMRARASIPQ